VDGVVVVGDEGGVAVPGEHGGGVGVVGGADELEVGAGDDAC